MPSFGPMLSSALRTARRKAVQELIPPAAGRTPRAAIAASKGPRAVGVFLPEVPTKGDPALRAATRTTQVPTEEPGDWLTKAKVGLRGFYRHEAGLPPDLRRRLIDAHALDNMTDNAAARALREVYEPILGDMNKVGLVTDLAIQADEVAQAVRGKKTTIRKWDPELDQMVEHPTEQWIESLGKLKEAAAGDESIRQVLSRREEFWADVFDQMVDDGLIVPERELADYTPLRRIHAIARGIDAANGDEQLKEVIGQIQRRGKGVAPREASLAAIEHAVFSRYLRWQNAHRLSESLLADEYLNRTKDYQPGTPLPKGWTEWIPAPSTPGFVPEGDLVKEAMTNIIGRGTKQSTFTGAGYVIPEELADALGRYRKVTDSGQLVKMSQRVSRLLTVYNPKNTVLNLMSDTPLALMGLPGEQSHPLGTIKWLGKGFEASMRDVFQGKGTIVEINGQRVDIGDLIQSEAVGGTTFATQVGATRVRPELEGLVQAPPQGWFQSTLDFARKTRQTIEQAPRIAAGLDALDRTGSEAEFGRVARAATLEYGIGTPDWARNPKLKLMAPFLEFAGLATGRVLDLLGTKGSRARAAAAVIGFPTAIMLWNHQNEEYRKIAESVGENWKDTPFIIVPDINGSPRRDVEGNPVVVPIRWSVPESVAQTFGMGNMAHRIQRVVRGLDTPLQAVKEGVTRIPRSMADFLTIPGIAKDLVSDRDQFGRPIDIGQKVQRVAPVLKIPAKTFEATRDYGPGEGALTFLSELTGLSPIKTAAKGGKTRDAGLAARAARVNEAKRRLSSARSSRRSPSELARLRQRYEEAVKELKRYVKERKEESDGTE